ncbi:methyltransferase domain-containing protein [Geitlerinema sp. CS-897]|nr:methyltransferase domain-containing protein [Geitlerinema sp. CS-897]
MDRKKRILQHLKKDGFGLEIGASYNPVAPKREGYKVEIVDHLRREELVEKYRNQGIDTRTIEEVDYVWTGGSYAELIKKNKFYDWIIASHVIEHTTDLIGFLNDCNELLKDDGILSLVVPDYRYCFDCMRARTSISEIIDAHLYKPKRHTLGSVIDYHINVMSKGNHICWLKGHNGKLKPLFSQQQIFEAIQQHQNSQDYIDVHAWCFTPHSFRLIIQDLYSLGFIKLKEFSFLPTSGFEFYVTLSRNGRGLSCDRLTVLEKIQWELAEILEISKNAQNSTSNETSTDNFACF